MTTSASVSPLCKVTAQSSTVASFQTSLLTATAAVKQPSSIQTQPNGGLAEVTAGNIVCLMLIVPVGRVLSVDQLRMLACGQL